MAQLGDLALPERPRFAQNIVLFARALRRAGLPIGPGQVIAAVRAVDQAGVRRRGDLYWALQASLISQPVHRAVFDQVFRLFWRDPRLAEHMMAMLMPQVRGANRPPDPKPAERRAVEGVLDGAMPERPAHSQGEELLVDASGTASGNERLHHMDFEQMSADELARARAILSGMVLPVPRIPTRRFVTGAGPQPDSRATLRQMMRQGGELSGIRYKTRRKRAPALVVVMDISGSMSRYSRSLLHFVHATAQAGQWQAVHAFTFGTRLTNISRHLKTRDVDEALAAAGGDAEDWEGGTRIGASLSQFNKVWSRRVLSQGAVTLLITDGLERGDADCLARAAERLGLSSRRLIWLNPLLRFDGFAPKAAGVRALLPHVDVLLSGHDIASVEGLVAAMAHPLDVGAKARLMRAL